jgi:hypothetical protein
MTPLAAARTVNPLPRYLVADAFVVGARLTFC